MKISLSYCCVSTDFLDKYLKRQDFELRYMDNNSAYLEMSGDSLDESSI